MTALNTWHLKLINPWARCIIIENQETMTISIFSGQISKILTLTIIITISDDKLALIFLKYRIYLPKYSIYQKSFLLKFLNFLFFIFLHLLIFQLFWDIFIQNLQYKDRLFIDAVSGATQTTTQNYQIEVKRQDTLKVIYSLFKTSY